VYYPVPGHAQVAFAGFGFDQNAFPVSERLAQQVLSLPMHTELTDIQQQYIVERLGAARLAAQRNEFA
jgi:dTDP-4-amino-4,6-dideoxygalactose transaminase